MRIDCLSYSVETFSCVHGNLECPDYEDSLDQTYKNCVTNPLSPPITCTWLNLNIVDPATGRLGTTTSTRFYFSFVICQI